MKPGFPRWQAGSARTVAVGLLACACVLSAAAQQQPRKPPPPGARPHWRGDIQRFHEHDWQLWRGGHWRHGSHTGRAGWWWVVGGTWYFYPTPVYPYPNPWEPPLVEYVAPPAGSPPPPPPAQYWYYCESAKSYYPYVPTCPGGWKQVPATPPK